MNITKTLSISLLIGLILFFSSCSVVKKITKRDNKHEVTTDTQAQEKTTTETATDSKIKTTTLEGVDTLLAVKGSTLEGSGKTGESFTLEDDKQVITITTDGSTTTAKSTVKDQKIPVKINKKTIREEDIKQTVKEKSDSSVNQKIHEKTKTSEVDKDVKRVPLWWIWILIVLAIVAFAWYKYYKS